MKAYHSILTAQGYKLAGSHKWGNLYDSPDGGGNVRVYKHQKGYHHWDHTHPKQDAIATGTTHEDLGKHLKNFHGSSQHSEEAAEEGTEQFGEVGKPVEDKDHFALGFNVRFHDGEHKGKVATLHSIIPKRYNKEETTYRGKLHGDFKSESARNILVTRKHLSKFAHYHDGPTQHDEEPAPSPKEQFNVRGTSFISSPVRVLEETTQHDESEQFDEGSYKELSSGQLAQEGHKVKIKKHLNGGGKKGVIDHLAPSGHFAAVKVGGKHAGYFHVTDLLHHKDNFS